MTAITRRVFAISAASSVAAMGNASKAAAEARLVDKRLLGRWESDAKKSAEYNETHVKLTDAARDVMRQMMGKCTYEFRDADYDVDIPAHTFKGADGRVFEFENFHETVSYSLLGSTSKSIAIKHAFLKIEEITVVNFEDEFIWIYDDATHWREYFKRVK